MGWSGNSSFFLLSCWFPKTIIMVRTRKRVVFVVVVCCGIRELCEIRVLGRTDGIYIFMFEIMVFFLLRKFSWFLVSIYIFVSFLSFPPSFQPVCYLRCFRFCLFLSLFFLRFFFDKCSLIFWVRVLLFKVVFFGWLRKSLEIYHNNHLIKFRFSVNNKITS